ncbi:hypothetical protein ABW19_dt0208174 [Dactylella cylindrospora]|nr:hypothetical protein ABW19_dt0208174 [Dactylella cylindrospora]
MLTMSVAPAYQMSLRRTVGEDMPENASGPVSLLFDYTLDFGREQTIIISRMQEPSEIPRPSDYVEVLPVAYYLSVDPRYRVVLLTPGWDTVAAISFASFQKPVVELMDVGIGTSPSRNIIKLHGKSKGNKMRFAGDAGEILSWEHQGKDDAYDLWVTEGVAGRSQPQTRRVGTMKRSAIDETETKRVIIDVNTRYIEEVTMLACALTVLKKEALQEKQKKIPSFKALPSTSRTFPTPYSSALSP